MPTTIADIVNGAAAYNVANAATTLTSNTPEMIDQVSSFEHDVFTQIAAENRVLSVIAGVTSAAGSVRTFDTATLGNVERLIRVTLATGGLINPVDVEDVDAEVGLRYVMQGTIITEVPSWDLTATGLALLITYAPTAAVLDRAGSANQTVTLPDKYVDLLKMRLAQYLAQKDMESRDPAEVSNLQGMYEGRLKTVLLSLDMYEGEVNRRFVNPKPWKPGSA